MSPPACWCARDLLRRAARRLAMYQGSRPSRTLTRKWAAPGSSISDSTRSSRLPHGWSYRKVNVISSSPLLRRSSGKTAHASDSPQGFLPSVAARKCRRVTPAASNTPPGRTHQTPGNWDHSTSTISSSSFQIRSNSAPSSHLHRHSPATGHATTMSALRRSGIGTRSPLHRGNLSSALGALAGRAAVAIGGPGQEPLRPARRGWRLIAQAGFATRPFPFPLRACLTLFRCLRDRAHGARAGGVVLSPNGRTSGESHSVMAVVLAREVSL